MVYGAPGLLTAGSWPLSGAISGYSIVYVQMSRMRLAQDNYREFSGPCMIKVSEVCSAPRSPSAILLHIHPSRIEYDEKAMMFFSKNSLLPVRAVGAVIVVVFN